MAYCIDDPYHISICFLSLFCRVVKSYVVKPGKDFSTEVTKQETDLTPEMIQR